MRIRQGNRGGDLMSQNEQSRMPLLTKLSQFRHESAHAEMRHACPISVENEVARGSWVATGRSGLPGRMTPRRAGWTGRAATAPAWQRGGRLRGPTVTGRDWPSCRATVLLPALGGLYSVHVHSLKPGVAASGFVLRLATRIRPSFVHPRQCRRWTGKDWRP